MPQSKDEDRSESAEPDAMKVARPVLNGGLRHEVVSVIVVLDMTS
jgi:hypothetical protein